MSSLFHMNSDSLANPNLADIWLKLTKDLVKNYLVLTLFIIILPFLVVYFNASSKQWCHYHTLGFFTRSWDIWLQLMELGILIFENFSHTYNN